jgi:hypothetical protein
MASTLTSSRAGGISTVRDGALIPNSGWLGWLTYFTYFGKLITSTMIVA